MAIAAATLEGATTPAAPSEGGQTPVQSPVASPTAGTSSQPTTVIEAPREPRGSLAPEPTQSPAGSDVASGQDTDDDDDIEDLKAKEILRLSTSALEKRLARHTKKELLAHFGTDKPDEIKARLQKLQEYEAAEEERKRAEMTDKERLDADLRQEKQLREEAEKKYQRIQQKRVVEKYETRISRIAEKHIDPEYSEVLFPKLARFLLKEYKGNFTAVNDRVIEKWFKDEVAKKPKIGREPPVVKRPLNNGPDDASSPKPNNNADLAGGKAFAPGRPNSMSPAEAKAHAAKLGYRW